MLEIEMKVGPKGQVVIPQAFRKALKIFPRSEVIFKMEGDKLILEKPKGNAVKIFREIAKSTPLFTRRIRPHEAHEEELEERLG
ncbi:MAG: AbrB/MazE/SpoVT family DNA-binding domain-containing protein [Euryarchaeota archaeon]|nr:AbrB/MazE/SpoVT family DNA-binding domain-containing protein [Euryarchaeota archaeon]